MADISQLLLEKEACVGQINRLVREIDGLTGAATNAEMVKSRLYDSFVERSRKFEDIEAWKGEKYNEFYEIYAGDYMGQCKRYLAELGQVTGEIQTEKNARERELEEQEYLIQEIAREVELLMDEQG